MGSEEPLINGVVYRRHLNGGGWVAETARVDKTAYVGPEAMGIDWMTGNGLSEAIPPAYTRWIGAQLLTHIQDMAVAA